MTNLECRPYYLLSIDIIEYDANKMDMRYDTDYFSYPPFSNKNLMILGPSFSTQQICSCPGLLPFPGSIYV